MKTVLEVKNLVKSYGAVHAVRGVSFSVKKGKCFGLLGPNGAGKSTTIEMVETIIRPDEGEILFEGLPIGKEYISELGVQFQETALPLQLTVREALDTFRSLYSKARPMEELIELCQLGSFQNQRHEKVSGGQRQRLLLAMALCHDPRLILLDEPTTGLDPQARRHLWKIVENIKKQGKTIILSTHYMEEAYELCDEIAIMDQGQIIAMGPPKALLEQNFRMVVVQIPEGELAEKFSKKANEFGSVHKSERGLEIHTESINSLLRELVKYEIDLSGIHIRQSNLEDLFLELTGKELRK